MTFHDIEMHHAWDAHGTNGLPVWDSEMRETKKIIGTLKYRISDEVLSPWLVEVKPPYPYLSRHD